MGGQVSGEAQPTVPVPGVVGKSVDAFLHAHEPPQPFRKQCLLQQRRHEFDSRSFFFMPRIRFDGIFSTPWYKHQSICFYTRAAK